MKGNSIDMRYATINDLMSSLGCAKWPERWAEIYDNIMDQYDKYGCEFADPVFYDRLGDRYDCLKEYREYYKEAAAEIAKDEDLSRLLLLLCTVAKDRAHAVADFTAFTPPVAPDGKREIKYDMLTALVMCATYDYTYGVLTAHKVPQKHLEYGMNVFDAMIKTFKARNDGAPGAMSWTWYQSTAVEAILYSTGRLDIEIKIKANSRVTAFENNESGEIVTLATRGKFHRDGMILGSKFYEDEAGAFEASIEETDDAWIGLAYDKRGFVDTKQKVVLKKSEWKKILEPGDPVVGLHIPPGGGMTPEKVDAAFAEAKEFLATCYPDFEYKAFKCESWLMDPQLATLLGEDSNITKFVNRFIPACGKSAGRGVFNFVFLHPNPAEAVVEELPEDTTLQRKIKQHYLNGGCIYEMHGFIPKDRI